MALFKKRETLVQNIAYMAIMAAINVIFVLLTAVLPPLMFLIVFVLPLTSAVVTLFCKKRYFPIYFVVTIGLCLLTTFGIYMWDTFFYVLPALITGFVFGILIEKNVPGIYIIIISALLQYVITYLTFLALGALIPGINFIDALLNIFGLATFEFKSIFVHSFLFILAFIQTLFTYVIIGFEIKKLGFSINLEEKHDWWLIVLSFVFICLSILMTYFYEPLLYVSVMINIPIIIYMVIKLILTNKKRLWAALVISLFAGIFIFAFCYLLIPSPRQLILITPLFGLILIIYFANYLFIEQKHVK